MSKPPTQSSGDTTPNSSNSGRTSPLGAQVRALGNRRGFFAKSSAALAGTAALATEQAIAGAGSIANHFHASGSDTIRLGLIGCGSRGRTVASEALRVSSSADGSPNDVKASTGGRVELVAMADAFADQLQTAYRGLNGRHRTNVHVGDRRFVGMNAWAELLQCDLDLVILATPPVFRPQQFSAAVKAGKHVLIESYAAVDGTGIQQMRSTAKIAREKKLVVAGGLPRRHQARSQDFVSRLQTGAIGELNSIQIRLPQHVNALAKRVDGVSRRDFELRNWRHFNWTSGDLNHCEHFHLLDLANWILQSPANSAIASGPSLAEGSLTILHGERQVSVGFADSTRSGSQYGDLEVHGTDGTFSFQRGQLRDRQQRVRWQSDLKEPAGGGTRAQVSAMIQAIQDGQCFDEAPLAIEATKTAILVQRCLQDEGRVLVEHVV